MITSPSLEKYDIKMWLSVTKKHLKIKNYIKKKTVIDLIKFIDFSYLTFHPNIVKDCNKFLRENERKKIFYILSNLFIIQ